MSHNRFARPAALWTAPAVPTARDLYAFDHAQYKAVNGDVGGSYAPASPIVIGGAGLALSGAGSILNGAQTLSGGRFRLGSNDYVTFAATRGHTEIVQVDEAQTFHGGAGLVGIGGTPNELSVLSLAPRGISPIASGGTFAVRIPSRYLHQGANLSQATLRLRALVRQPSAPSSPAFMTANIFAMNAANTAHSQLVPTFGQWQASHAYTVGSIIVPSPASGSTTGLYYVCNAISGTGTSGSVPPTWASGVGAFTVDNPGANQISWFSTGYAGIAPTNTTGVGPTYAGGAVQLSNMSPQTTFVIDTTTYDYFLKVTYDGFGSGTSAAPNWLLHSLALAYNSIADMRPE